MTIDAELTDWFGSQGLQVRRRIRVLMLLDAADYAVISPISGQRFHTFAFLADVLSPIYNFRPTSSRILKRRLIPYFPDLQWEVDRLIGLDLIAPTDLTPVIESSRAYVTLSLSLHRLRATPVLEVVYSHHEFSVLRDYFRELAGALSNVQDSELDHATRQDMTWNSGHMGSLIDYAEWRAQNYSILGANKIEEFVARSLGDHNTRLSPLAKVTLYVKYLRRAAYG